MKKLWLSILAVLTVSALLICTMAEMPEEPNTAAEGQEFFAEAVEEFVPEEEEFLLENDEVELSEVDEDYAGFADHDIDAIAYSPEESIVMPDDIPMAGETFVINGVVLPFDFGYIAGTSDYSGCYALAKYAYEHIFGIEFNQRDNFDFVTPKGAVIETTGANLKEWILKAGPGAVMRVTSRNVWSDYDNAGHSIVIVDCNEDGAWIYQADSHGNIMSNNQVVYYPWDGIAKKCKGDTSYDGYYFSSQGQYIKYIKYPGKENFNQKLQPATNLYFKDVIYPQTFKIDTTNGWNLSGGTLASNYDLKSIKSMIVDANGNTISSGSQSLSGKYFSIRSLDTFSSSDNGVKFSYIGSEGSYKWILIATDSNNRTLRLVMPFTAVSSGSTSTASMGKEFEDYYTVKSENVTYKVIKDVTARKTPFDDATKGSKYTKGKKIVSVAIVQNKYNNLWIKTNDSQYIYSGYHVEENDTVTKTGNQYFEVDNGGNSSSFAASLASLFILDVNAETINTTQDDTMHGGGGRTIEDSDSQQSEQWTYRVITSDGLNMRNSATSSGNYITTLWPDTTIKVTQKASADGYTWGYGTSSNGYTGWIVVDNNWTTLVSATADTTSPSVDSTAPTITDVRVTDVSATGYTVSCNVSDDVGVTKVSFPTWTLNNDQDDLFSNWPDTATGTVSNGTATYRVNTSDHNNESGCTYRTHIYAFDAAGNIGHVNQGDYGILDVSVPAPHTHTPVTDAAIAAACTTEGKTEGSHCSVCGEVLVAQQSIPATGHTPVTDPAVAPTSTTTGLTEGSHCSVCGTVLVAQQAVSKQVVSQTTVYVTGVKFETNSVSMSQGETSWLIATVSPANATNQKVSYSTSDKNIAYIDSNGILCGVGPGTATITATTEDGGKTASCTVTVASKIQKQSLPQKGKNGTVTLNKGEKLQLVPDFATSLGLAVSSYKSSKPAVASVDANGLVTAAAEGKAKITVTTNNKKVKATITVQVVDPYKPTGIGIAQGKAITLTVGQPVQLYAALAPETARATLTWKSSKTKVATVDAGGIVTPLAEGKAKITVTTHNKKKATIAVTVVDPNKPLGIGIAQGKAITLKVGEGVQLWPVMNPATAQSALTWKSGKAAVASVDANGYVAALKKGKAKITVTTYNKKKATITVNVVE